MNIELIDQPSTELTVQDRASIALESDKTRMELTALATKYVDMVRSMFSYDENTGLFVRKKIMKFGNQNLIGQIAGYFDKTGYGYLKIGGIRISQHRLAWLHFYGKWPDYEIDHIDGDPSNNAISNLRDVKHRINVQNLKVARKSCKSGAMGVNRHGNKWRARIRLNSRLIHIGLFDSKELAHEAFILKKRELHEGNTL